jgi:hypothetical protein
MPRLRRLENIENHGRELKVKRMRHEAKNREEWAGIIMEAKVSRGP